MKVRVSLGATVQVGNDYVKAIIDIEDEVAEADGLSAEEHLGIARKHSDVLSSVAGELLTDRLNEVIDILEGDKIGGK